MYLRLLLLFSIGSGSTSFTYSRSIEASIAHPQIEFQESFQFMNAINPEHVFWKDAVIPFEFDSRANIPAHQLDLIKRQMERIANNTCVRFVPRTNEFAFLRFEIGEHIDNNTCSASCPYLLGLRGDNGCTIEMAPWCFENEGVIEHELLHVVGLAHEHQRYDRDEHVEIMVDNLKSGSAKDFRKYSCQMFGTYGCPYNFDSIMQYPKNLKSKNGEITIRTLDPKEQDTLGRRAESDRGAHPNDYEKVNRIYGCTVKALGHTCQLPPYEIAPNCSGYKRVVTASPNP